MRSRLVFVCRIQRKRSKVKLRKAHLVHHTYFLICKNQFIFNFFFCNMFESIGDNKYKQCYFFNIMYVSVSALRTWRIRIQLCRPHFSFGLFRMHVSINTRLFRFLCDFESELWIKLGCQNVPTLFHIRNHQQKIRIIQRITFAVLGRVGPNKVFSSC